MKLLTISASLLLLIPAIGHSKEWNIDTGHSRVGFSVRHLGLSNVKGTFSDYSAEVTANAKTGQVTSVQATVKVSSVNTGMDRRDEHLKAGDFFDAAKFPEMKLVSKKITYKDKKVTAVTFLTIKGVTKKVIFKGEQLGTHKVNFGNGDQLRTGYSASTEINRKDFGLTFNAIAEGVKVVADTVKIELEMELFKDL